MKSVFACVGLSLVSACAFAAEPTMEASGQCVAPVIPSVSTSTVGALRVARVIDAWKECVAKQDNEETQRLDLDIQAQTKQWLAATVQYSNGNASHNGVIGRQEYEKYEQRLTFVEREKIKAILRKSDPDRLASELASLDAERLHESQRLDSDRRTLPPATGR